MAIILPANTLATASGVANSCRFNDGDSAYMHQTPSGNGSNTVFTLSLWYKRGVLGTGQSLFAAGTSGVTTLDFLSGDTLAFYDGGSTTVFITNRVFRDIASWYHIALICNTGESGTDKCKLYINGTQVGNVTSGSSLPFAYPDILLGQQRVALDTGTRNPIDEFMVFNEALSDSELQLLTSFSS